VASDPINLTDLKRLLAEMTQGEWSWDDRDGEMVAQQNKATITVIFGEPSYEANHRACIGDADISGIVALVNAAPVLVEIVDAVLDCVRLRKQTTAIRIGPMTDGYGDRVNASSKALSAANDRLASALTKVTR